MKEIPGDACKRQRFRYLNLCSSINNYTTGKKIQWYLKEMDSLYEILRLNPNEPCPCTFTKIQFRNERCLIPHLGPLFKYFGRRKSILIGTHVVACGKHVHDDVIKWKHIPRYWQFVRGIHRSPVNSLHKGQWRGALMFSLICIRINGWVNNG